MTAAQKRQAKHAEQNERAARLILSDPQYVPSSLMQQWATAYLANRQAEKQRAGKK
jgi:hypothetical protein